MSHHSRIIRVFDETSGDPITQVVSNRLVMNGRACPVDIALFLWTRAR